MTVCSALLWNEEVCALPAYTGWPYTEGRLARLRNRLGYAGWHWYMRPVLAVINRYRKKWKLAPFAGISDTYSPLGADFAIVSGIRFPSEGIALGLSLYRLLGRQSAGEH